MEHREPLAETSSNPSTRSDQAWLSASLFVVLCLLAAVLLEALDRVSAGGEPYHRSWLARAIDLGYWQLQQAGMWLVAAGLAGWCLGLVLRASSPRRRGALLFGGVVVVVLGLVAVTDAACLTGYRASDGTCAWE